jgi:transposase-like protein
MTQPSLWNQLRIRLLAATSAHGAKSALAREFSVTPASVSEWLSGASAPTAETALQLLKWVERAECKQGSPGSAQTPPERATRTRKSRNDNLRSSQQKW